MPTAIYRKFLISYTEDDTWEARHEDYDGNPNAGDERLFVGISVDHVRQEIDDWWINETRNCLASLIGMVEAVIHCPPTQSVSIIQSVLRDSGHLKAARAVLKAAA